MRTALLRIAFAALSIFALVAPSAAADVAQKPADISQKAARQLSVRPHPSFAHCCREKVWDARGAEIGDLLAYDERYGPQQLIGFVAYHLKSGDAVTLQVTPEVIQGLQPPGGSTALFTTPDCSGNAMFAMIPWPPLAKRYATVLLGGNPGTLNFSASSAWLWVTDPLPPRVLPAGPIFHSQWDNGACAPLAAPGYTVSGPFGGFWMHRVEDLFVKYKRPFYVDY